MRGINQISFTFLYNHTKFTRTENSSATDFVAVLKTVDRNKPLLPVVNVRFMFTETAVLYYLLHRQSCLFSILRYAYTWTGGTFQQKIDKRYTNYTWQNDGRRFEPYAGKLQKRKHPDQETPKFWRCASGLCRYVSEEHATAIFTQLQPHILITLYWQTG
jgi:hypothetical protein